MGVNVNKCYPRYSTKYPGVFYREAKRIAGNGTEKVFYVVFKKDGIVHEEKTGRQFADRMTPAKAARIRAERIEGKRPSPKEIRQIRKAKRTAWTFNRLWEEYKRQNPGLKDPGADESRFNRYLEPAFGAREPHDLLPLDAIRLRNKIMKKKSPQTAKLTLALLRRLSNFGANNQLCAPMPFRLDKKIMPKVDNEKTEDLTSDQLSRLLEVIEKDEHPQAGPIMKMALFTGMRKSELFRLRWVDIDFERGFITIRKPKGGKTVKIPLNDGAREVLLNHTRTTSTFVFPGRGGQQRTDIHKAANKIKDKAKLPKHFRALHGLRHTFASTLASSGKVDLYTLQRLLTHRDPKMTQRYAHLRDEALKRASDLAGEIINETVKAEKKESEQGDAKIA